MEWLHDLFRANDIDKTELWEHIQKIANKEYRKKNGLILQGPPNCFKPQLLRLLFSPLHIAPMTRSNSSNNFWLQSVINQPLCLYEEPLITPQDVNDWKLILEGAVVKTPVKNQPDELVERTPFFITTNEPLGKWINRVDNEAIKERVITHVFRIQINNDADQGRFRMAPSTITPIDIFMFLNYA